MIVYHDQDIIFLLIEKRIRKNNKYYINNCFSRMRFLFVFVGFCRLVFRVCIFLLHDFRTKDNSNCDCFGIIVDSNYRCMINLSIGNYKILISEIVQCPQNNTMFIFSFNVIVISNLYQLHII